MLQVALYQPEIPSNTGNVIRLCANVGAQLHLICPLGFALDNRRLRRAGLDYHEFVGVTQHANLAAFQAALAERRTIALTTHANTHYCDFRFSATDVLLFGAETRGLPATIRDHGHALRLPMRPQSRSLNLANSVAVVLYEAWRQLGFSGGR